MSRGIRTLNDFKNNEPADSGEESGGEGQSFYVGGSEHSGQQVVGPPRGRDGNLAERVFDAARQHGAEAIQEEPAAQGSRVSSQFPGGGVRLDSAVASTEGASANVASAEADPVSNEVVVRLLMWENGFSLDDGPLRTLEDPQNAEFLKAIMKGQIPQELLAAHPRKQIDLRMERKAGEYQAPKMKPFHGSGARLGAIVPDVVVNTEPSQPQAPSQDDAAKALADAQAKVSLETGAPVTQVQIRMNNGQRVVGRFNHTHTISTIREFVVNARPDLSFTPFQFMTTFPNKVVDDENQSISDAGLLNSVVVIKPVA